MAKLNWDADSVVVAHIARAERIDAKLFPTLAPAMLLEAAHTGEVPAQYTTRGGEPLEVPIRVPLEVFAAPYEVDVGTLTFGGPGPLPDPGELGGIRYCREAYRKRFPLRGTPSPEATHSPGPGRREKKPGRKEKFSWDLIMREFLPQERAYRERRRGRPLSLRRFTDIMLRRLGETFDEDSLPEERTLRDRIAIWVSALPEWRS